MNRLVFAAPSRLVLCTAAFASLLTVAACGGSSDDSAGGKAGKGGSTADGGGVGDAAVSGDAGTRSDAGIGGDGGAAAGTKSALITAAKGGKLVSADGKLALEFPAGALKADTTISVREATKDELIPEFAGKVLKQYVLEPDGTKFDKAVTLTLAFPTAELQALADADKLGVKVGPTAALLLPLMTRSGGKVAPVDSQVVDMVSEPNKAILSGEIHHFSEVAALYLDGDQTLLTCDVSIDKKVGESRVGSLKLEGPYEKGVLDIYFVKQSFAETPLGKITESCATGDRTRECTITCDEKGRGVLKAIVTVAMEVPQDYGYDAEVRLFDTFACAAAPVSTCTPSGTVPTAPPTFDIGPNLTRCRGSTINVDASHAQGTNCFEAGGVTWSDTCTSGSYCQLQIPDDAAAGNTTLKITTQAGSAETAETFEILDATAPHITGYSPDPIHPGDTVTVTGTGFLRMGGVDFINGNNPPVTPTISDKTDTSFTFIAPAIGDYSVYVIGSPDCGSQINPPSTPHLVVVAP